MVGALMKSLLSPRPLPHAARSRLLAAFPEHGAYLADHLQGALPAISLVTQSALLPAYANDIAADMVFVQQVYGYGRADDAVLALSTSGDSPTVLRALEIGRTLGLSTLGLTGRSGGRMHAICDVTSRVPHDRTPEIQERHLPIYHALCLQLEATFFAPLA